MNFSCHFYGQQKVREGWMSIIYNKRKDKEKQALVEKVVCSGLNLSSHARQQSRDGHQPVNLQVQSENVLPHGLAKPWRFPLLGPHPAPGMGAGAPAPLPRGSRTPCQTDSPPGSCGPWPVAEEGGHEQGQLTTLSWPQDNCEEQSVSNPYSETQKPVAGWPDL